MTDYAARLQSSFIACASNGAYNFGTGDFSVTALVLGTQPGTVVSRKGASGGSNNGGWLLILKPGGAITFATDNGFGYYVIDTAATNVLDGMWHHLVATRTAGKLAIHVDCRPVTATVHSTAATPLNVSNAQRLLIGNTDQTQQPYRQFNGFVEDVTLWNRAISMEEMTRTMCNAIDPNAPGLVGYWSMDRTLADASPVRNNGVAQGSVTYQEILRCDCCYGDNDYCFVGVSNDGGGTTAVLTRNQQVQVTAGTPGLLACVVTSYDDYTFPNGVQMTVQDPSGRVYSKAQNDEQAFVQVASNGSVQMFAIQNPAAGMWQINTSAPGTARFQIVLQSAPAADVSQTVQQTLEPIYGPGNMAVSDAAAKRAMGVWGWIGAAAVTVGLGILTVATLGATTPVLVGVIAAVAVADTAIVVAAAQQLPSGQPGTYYTDAGGDMGQFTTVTSTYVLGDANNDDATKRLYASRVNFYGYLTTIKSGRVQLKGPKFVTAQVNSALTQVGVRYFTASAHGQPSYLVGYDAKDILRVGSYPPAAANGKAFHLLACSSGASLGKDLVKNGATCFFGYTKPFKLLTGGPQDAFLDCDSRVDYQLAQGATAGQAQDVTVAQFQAQIALFEQEGNHNAAVILQEDLDCFVGPRSSADYGNVNAKIV